MSADEPAVNGWQAATEAHMSTSAIGRGLAQQIDRLREQYNAVLLELAEVRAQLAARAWLVARDGGRNCERCKGEICRGEAYDLEDDTWGLIAHVRCPDRKVPPRTRASNRARAYQLTDKGLAATAGPSTEGAPK